MGLSAVRTPSGDMSGSGLEGNGTHECFKWEPWEPNPLFYVSSARELTGIANGDDLLRMHASMIGVPAGCGAPACIGFVGRGIRDSSRPSGPGLRSEPRSTKRLQSFPHMQSVQWKLTASRLLQVPTETSQYCEIRRPELTSLPAYLAS